jgi:tetratricopeptide (TPR) repeat protein
LAAVLFAVSGSSMANDVEDPDTLEGAVVSDADLPQAKLPVLEIDGKENSDVYLQSLDIMVEVTGNIASTRYTMVFKNETDRILEGLLTFPLPDGRSVTFYALDINGKMREAVPVEKAKGTQVFEEIEQRQVDPGLLERVEGNNFRTRVYPIPAGGIRTVSIGYEEELTLENGLLYYRLPMAYPNPLKKFAVKATVWKSSLEPIVPESENEIRFDAAGENYVASFTREDYRPAGALVFALPASADIPQVMTQPAQGSYYFLASAAPKMETRKKQWNNNLAIIWDVSLSGSQRDLRREMEMLDIIFTEKKDADIHLYFLNNKIVKNGDYKVVGGKWDGLKKVLETAIFDGGTDFSTISLNNIAGNEILFFSDGISTLSDADFLKNATAKRPIHCVVSSAKADYSAMKLIAGKTKGKFINVNALSSEKLKSELLNETLQFLGTEHGNAVSEVYPGIAAPVQGNFSVAGISGTADAELTLLFGFGNKVEKRIKVKLDAKKAAGQGNVYKIWAQKKIAELDLDYEKNRAELTELGQQFGIVTRNTSLIVLETVDDYVRYDIEPPAAEPELRAEYQRKQKERDEKLLDTERDMLEKAVAAADGIRKWWNAGFTPKTSKYPMPDGSNRIIDGILGNMAGLLSGGKKGPAAGGVYAESRIGAIRNIFGSLMLGGFLIGCSQPRGNFAFEAAEVTGYLDPKHIASQPTITIKPIKKDNDYLNKLTGKTADDYQIYLKLRDNYANSPTFYFDMADWFYTRGDMETALRVLTSIAELELENASLYRLLGYRLKEYGKYALEKFVCRKVVQWRPMDPQSYRDYALALAGNGEAQAALDSLYSLLTKPYSDNTRSRSNGIEEVVVTEINHLIAKNPGLNTSQIDKRLIVNAPVDIRVVINWNMDNTDIDLHVKDPNGEECYYKHRKTRIGGRISTDIRGGYGPEQFLLKNAKKGKYQVYVNYYGDRQFTVAGPSTVMAEIYTKYAGKAEQRKIVALQMSKTEKKNGSKVEVAEFNF